MGREVVRHIPDRSPGLNPQEKGMLDSWRRYQEQRSSNSLLI